MLDGRPRRDGDLLRVHKGDLSPHRAVEAASLVPLCVYMCTYLAPRDPGETPDVDLKRGPQSTLLTPMRGVFLRFIGATPSVYVCVPVPSSYCYLPVAAVWTVFHHPTSPFRILCSCAYVFDIVLSATEAFLPLFPYGCAFVFSIPSSAREMAHVASCQTIEI